MNTYLLLFLQLAVPPVMAALAMAYLSGALSRLLEELCGTAERADFWVRMTWIACVLVPLTWMMMFGGGTEQALADAIRAILGASLAGLSLSLGTVALVLWRFIPPSSVPRES